MKLPRIFLDLDGVMADFDKRYFDLFGEHPHDRTDAGMWKNIDSEKYFFRHMPLMTGAKKFFDQLHGDCNIDLSILTACPRSNYYEVAVQKRQWVHEHLSADVRVLPVMGGKNKCLFMENPGDILIDDHQKNIGAWVELDGIGILHRNFNQTCIDIWNRCPAIRNHLLSNAVFRRASQHAFEGENL